MKIHNVINNTNQKSKLKFNITAQTNNYITNINRLLKDVKSEISADYI